VQLSAPLWALAVSPDGKTVATTDSATIRLIDLTSGKDRLTFTGHPSTVFTSAVTPDGRTIATGSGSDVFLWDAASGQLRRRLRGHQGYVNGMALLDGGRKLVTSAYQDKSLRVWDLVREKEAGTLNLPDGSFILQSVTPEGKTIALGGGTGNVVVMDGHTGKVLQTLQAGGDAIYGAAFTPDGRKLVVCHSQDNMIRVWDLVAGKVVHTYSFLDAPDPGRPPAGGGRPVYYNAVSPDRRLIALGSQFRFLEVRDLLTGEVLQRVNDLPDGVCPMAFSPDGRTLAWAGWKSATVHLIEVATGRERHSFPGKIGRVIPLSFTADGTALVAGADDTTALVWDLTGRLAAKDTWGRSLTTADLDAAWADLAGDDALKAYRTVQKLSGSAKDAIPYLGRRLRPVPAADETRLTRLIADLDSEDFAVRENATKELEKLEDTALGRLRKALAGEPSAEARRRLELLVRRQADQSRNPTPERRRVLRCLEVLERIGTPEAAAVLETLAKGAPGASLTEDAKAALGRMKGRTS